MDGDDSDYRFVVATDVRGYFLGAGVEEISTLFFSPPSDVPSRFLVNIEVVEAPREMKSEQHCSAVRFRTALVQERQRHLG